MSFGPHHDSSYYERMERLQAQAARAEEVARFVGNVYVMSRAALKALVRLVKPANDDDAGRRAA
jgi:hypothetical protein